MAAPDGIVWGSIVGGYGKIGIYTKVTTSGSTASVNIQAWFASKYSVEDSNNSYYFSNGSTTASGGGGSISIKHTVDSGSGWDPANQTKLGEATYRDLNRASVDQTINCAIKLSGIDRVGGTMTATTSYVIPGLDTYTIKYDANGGTGAPSNQTKWYGIDLKLPTTTPTRTGYTFAGWGTSATATSAKYAPGDFYTANASITLYAVWTTNGYPIHYDANGGIDAPPDQIMIKGETFVITNAVPTRDGYEFLGWSVSPTSTTAIWQPGEELVSNASLTLYAVWAVGYSSPKIENLTVARTDRDGNVTDKGTYFTVIFDWTTHNEVSGITIDWRASTDSTGETSKITTSGTSGSVNKTLGYGTIETETTYVVDITVRDDKDSTTLTRTLAGAAYSIDFLRGGNGVAIGKPAETEGLFDVQLNTKLNSELEVAGISTFNGEEFVVNSETKIYNDFNIYNGNNSVVNVQLDYNGEPRVAIVSDVKLFGDIYDKNDNIISDGIAVYNTSQNPNSTTEHALLTSNNTPNSANMYIVTYFRDSKDTSNNRMQLAFPHSGEGPLYYRYYTTSWSTWRGLGSSKYVTGTSTTSVATGEIWHDGKPIYRRVVNYSLTSTKTLTTVGTVSDFGALVNMTGSVLRSSKYRPLDFYYSSSDYNLVTIDTSGKIQVNASDACTYSIILEYTRK